MRRKRQSGATRAGARDTSGGDRIAARDTSGGLAESKRPEPGEIAAPESPAGALAPGLYIVATPIGNARDISLRALDVLRRVDLVACEDTRTTGSLLAMHGISARRTPYHEHNAERVRPLLLDRLRRGERLALVSDAGTPLVSDPGYKLVRDAAAAGLPVTAIPGASASLAALVLSGLPTDRFLFAGFLPAKRGARQAVLAELAPVGATLVFYESAPRLADSLADMAQALGDRPAAVARELTKLFEEVRRGRLAELAAHYAETGPPKGELVVIVAPGSAAAAAADDAALDARLRRALATMTVRDASEAVAEATGASRRKIYARALEILGEDDKP